MADPRWSTSLAALSRFFVGDGSLGETLTRVADLTEEAIPNAALVGITMPVEGRHRAAVFAHETTAKTTQSANGTNCHPDDLHTHPPSWASGGAGSHSMWALVGRTGRVAGLLWGS